MSHIVEIKTEVRDAQAVAAACQRLGWSPPVQATVQLYSDTATGLRVELPGWVYPVVCDVASGAVRYDNFGGRWGEEATLHRFLQAYAVEKTRLEARRRGYLVTEQPLADGSIRLQLTAAGGAT